MTLTWLRMTAVVAALLPAMAGAADKKTFLGLAYDMDTGAPLYKALHQVDLDEAGQYQQYRVDYASFDGAPIARKDLRFQKREAPGLFRPDLAFLDHRNRDQTETKHLRHDQVELRASGEDRALIDFDATQLVVIDAGFDRLVMNRWERLTQGETIAFDFLALTRASFVGLQLSKTPEQPNKERMRLKIDASNWFLSLLMEPIFLEYDLVTRNLMRYEGLTNIPRSDDKRFDKVLDENYRAVIEYQYDINDAELHELATLMRSPDRS